MNVNKKTARNITRGIQRDLERAPWDEIETEGDLQEWFAALKKDLEMSLAGADERVG